VSSPDGLHLVLHGVRPPSWNRLKRMNRWQWQSAVEQAKWHIRAALPPGPPVFTGRVDICIVAYFDRKPYDSSNIPLKLYEDGLINLVIPDDSPRYVRRVSTESRVDRQHPRVEILVRPVEEEQGGV
jgi:hypothetical protein